MTFLPVHQFPAAPQRLLVGVALLLLVIPGVAAQGAGHSSPAPPAAPAESLYVSGPISQSNRLTRLDPATLANLPGAALDLSGIVSAAGGTLVVQQTNSPAGGALVVRDLRTGVVRSRIQSSAMIGYSALSADGNRLLVISGQQSAGPGLTTIPAWTVYDTATGRQVAAIPDDALGFDVANVYVFQPDPTLRHLYALVVPEQDSGKAGPWPARLVAYDLTTGHVAGRLTLADVLAGSWPTGAVIHQEPVVQDVRPALAISPDGRTLAIVHADGNAVTLVDATHLRVARTVVLAPRRGLLARILAWLPLFPQTAEAKLGLNGTVRQAAFSPDGQRLYIYGETGTIKPDGTADEHGLGLTVVDLTHGTIEASGLPNIEVDGIILGPDGHDVYATGMIPVPNATTPDLRLWRLDATSLRVEATRRFAGYRRVLFLPDSVASVAA